MLFSRKKKRKNIQIHPAISLNNIQIERAFQHKHQGILLDEKLDFKQHVDILYPISVIKNSDIVCHGNP